MAPRGRRVRGLAWLGLSQPGFDPGYGKLICQATLMSSDRTKQICLWVTIYIYIYIYINYYAISHSSFKFIIGWQNSEMKKKNNHIFLTESLQRVPKLCFSSITLINSRQTFSTNVFRNSTSQNPCCIVGSRQKLLETKTKWRNDHKLRGKEKFIPVVTGKYTTYFLFEFHLLIGLITRAMFIGIFNEIG